MLSKRIINSNDAGGGVCTSDITDIFEDGSGIALYQLNWDGSDMSGNYNGTATDVSFVNGKINEAGSFNGSSSQIDISATATTPVDFSQRNYSISLWAKTTSTVTGILISKYGDSDSLRAFTIQSRADGTIQHYERGTGTFETTDSTTTIDDGNWHHIVVTKSSTQTIIYIDGLDDVTNANTFTSNNGGTEPIRIGRDNPGSPEWFNGQIDQVRIFNKALSSTEVTTLYNEVACEKTCTTNDNQLVSDCIAYYKMDGNADDALNTYDGTPTNVSWTQGRFGSAGGFNGSNSYIYNTNTSLWSSSISISAWYKTLNNSQRNPIVLIGRGSWSDGFELQVPSTNTIGFAFAEGSKFGIFNSSVNLNDGNWHHYVQVSDSSTAKFYIDGVEQTGITFGNGNSRQGSGIRIGRFFQTPEQWAKGSIDQVRIYDRAITAAEVTTLYNEVQCPSTASFNTIIYDGDGDNGRAVGGVGFQPDLVWAKRRSAVEDNAWFDSVRGVQKQIVSNKTNAESTKTNALSSFNSDGFTTGSNNALNTSGQTYVAWCWKAGGDAVTNTDGSITSEVSANVDAGFSIVSYTGNGTAGATVGHGLDTAPKIVIVKYTSTTGNWWVQNVNLGVNSHLQLNTTAAENTSAESNPFNNSYPTDSVFTVGSTNVGRYANANSTTTIAYCFAEVEGFSSFGSYVGTGASGNTVVTGFEPAFVMIKRTDSSLYNWNIMDNKRGNGDYLLAANTSSSEVLGETPLDFNSNGFTITTIDNYINQTGGTYIYMAFANQF